jgi:hypothetical protein
MQRHECQCKQCHDVAAKQKGEAAHCQNMDVDATNDNIANDVAPQN